MVSAASIVLMLGLMSEGAWLRLFPEWSESRGVSWRVMQNSL